MTKVCSVEGCEKKHYGKELCSMHYTRELRYGDTSYVKRIRGVSITKNTLYATLINIKARCYNTNNEHYKNYGGRGVIIDKRRLGTYGFINFLKDMGEKPEGMSLDRINNDGNYEPGNCRRATVHEQNSNKRNNNVNVGVCYNKRRNNWLSYMNIDGKSFFRKEYNTEQEAINARKEAELQYLNLVLFFFLT